MELQIMEEYLQRLERSKQLEKSEIKNICTKAIDILIREPNLVQVNSPVKICGDIHGQYHDLLNIFRLQGTPRTTKYIFLGDYVDRGRNSLSTYLTLLIYKVMYPQNITLIRGNHESICEIRRDLGFYKELRQNYATDYDLIYMIVAQTFLYLNVGSVVDGRILCVHGGISPLLKTLSQIQEINRFKRTTEQLYLDIMWSDPHDYPGYAKNQRGMGVMYGPDVIKRFLVVNNLNYLIRAHQYVKEGFRFDFEDKNTITVWSAPNYMYRFNNVASVLKFYGQMEITKNDFFIFRDAEYNNSNRK